MTKKQWIYFIIACVILVAFLAFVIWKFNADFMGLSTALSLVIVLYAPIGAFLLSALYFVKYITDENIKMPIWHHISNIVRMVTATAAFIVYFQFSNIGSYPVYRTTVISLIIVIGLSAVYDVAAWLVRKKSNRN